MRAGAFDAVVCEHWEHGGQGAVALAQAVERACSQESKFEFLYDVDLSIKEKIEIIAKQVYRADGVEYSPEAEAAISKYSDMGFVKLPICMAKTQYSFSHEASRKGAPSGFMLPIRCGTAHTAVQISLDSPSPGHVCLQGRGSVCRGRVCVPVGGHHDDDARVADAAVLL